MGTTDISAAKCTKLAFNAAVNFRKEPGSEVSLSGFDIEAYTGAVVDRWWGKLAIEVAGISAKKQIPIFKNHNRDEIVGYSTSTSKDSSFRVSGVFSKTTKAALEVVGLATEGFPWQASIGVMPKKILELKENAMAMVNGKRLTGPAEVWLESEVFETSFVPLGADSDTSVACFSDIQEIAEGEESKRAMVPKKSMRLKMDITELKNEYPDLVAAIALEATAGMEAKISAAKLEGAASERDRIVGVKAQCVPGHEALIESLAYDGKTTPAEAAMQVIAAEKVVKASAAEAFKASAPAVIPPVNNDTPDTGEDLNAPIEDRAKAAWDKSPDLRDEFRGKFSAYLAYRKAEAAGQVKIFNKK